MPRISPFVIRLSPKERETISADKKKQDDLIMRLMKERMEKWVKIDNQITDNWKMGQRTDRDHWSQRANLSAASELLPAVDECCATAANCASAGISEGKRSILILKDMEQSFKHGHPGLCGNFEVIIMWFRVCFRIESLNSQ